MKEYSREDILQIAFDAFPQGKLKPYGFYTKLETEQFYEAITNKKSDFRKLYEFLCKTSADDLKRSRDIRDFIFGVKKRIKLNDLEKNTMKLMEGDFYVDRMMIYLADKQKIRIEDSAVTLHESCCKYETPTNMEMLYNKFIFFELNTETEKRYVLRNREDDELHDFTFSVRKGKKRGDFSQFIFNTQGLSKYNPLHSNHSLDDVVDYANNLKAQVRDKIFSDEFVKDPTNRDCLRRIQIGVIAKIMRANIFQRNYDLI